MDSLPNELVELILLWDVRMCRCQKNTILRLRLVCKAFDVALKPYVFKTLQLEYSRFLRSAPAPNIEALASIGRLCQAVYVDMMVVRDEGTTYSAFSTSRSRCHCLFRALIDNHTFEM